MLGNGGRRGEGLDVIGPGIDRADEFVDVGPISQGLDTAGGGAGADRDEKPALPANLANSPCIGSRGDRAFDQCDVVRAGT